MASKEKKKKKKKKKKPSSTECGRRCPKKTCHSQTRAVLDEICEVCGLRPSVVEATPAQRADQGNCANEMKVAR
jgi:hypothetical protein